MRKKLTKELLAAKRNVKKFVSQPPDSLADYHWTEKHYITSRYFSGLIVFDVM